MTEQHGVFLGNLDDSGSKEDVAEMICRLIQQACGLSVELSAIHLRPSKPCQCLTAHISTSSQAEQRMIIESLRNNTGSIPGGLVKTNRHLKIDTFKPKTQRCYVKGQQLGNETRILEFKRGGGDDIKQHIKRHLAKYMCAFLNGQGGSLMFGVDDSGNVQGVHCDRKQEDNVRINIDNIIQQFHPPVLPQMYEIHFVPVKYEAGIKVIEISVIPGRPDILYETPSGEVYIRRDGSVRGPLRAREIQEWCRLHLKFTEEFNTTDEGALQHKVEALQERLQKLESAHEAGSASSASSQAEDKHDIKRKRKSADEVSSAASFSSSDSASISPLNKHKIKKTNSTVCTIL